eukprot:CAMPEP_0119477018 /NCGR_PEP_ID=MMETSP1344-20130328/7323_1 /TAXON_ID=236787 /ORGANISM="Florenciella parvula, Strain CCMP2471" /LENGTH=144 /DNA_ID=CAMNT_0007510917 /DNA_START=39 /DNA_END=471 /DNA_ORIENTATION=+
MAEDSNNGSVRAAPRCVAGASARPPATWDMDICFAVGTNPRVPSGMNHSADRALETARPSLPSPPHRPSRRARKDPNEAPVFLQKTFQMVDTVRGNGGTVSASSIQTFTPTTPFALSQCPDDIGGWSENGDTFIVKDMEAFANL